LTLSTGLMRFLAWVSRKVPSGCGTNVCDLPHSIW